MRRVYSNALTLALERFDEAQGDEVQAMHWATIARFCGRKLGFKKPEPKPMAAKPMIPAVKGPTILQALFRNYLNQMLERQAQARDSEDRELVLHYQACIDRVSVKLRGSRSTNVQAMASQFYEELLELFPEQYRDKLRIYTCEELYYVYRLAIFRPRRVAKSIGEGKAESGRLYLETEHRAFRSADVPYLALRAKLFRWLKGQEKHPIYPSAWNKLGSRFRTGFYEEYGYQSTPKDLPKVDMGEAVAKLSEHFKSTG